MWVILRKLQIDGNTASTFGYLHVRIQNVSQGHFNPYNLKQRSNNYKNAFDSRVTKHKTTTVNEHSRKGVDDRRHLMNYCLNHSGKYSNVVESL